MKRCPSCRRDLPLDDFARGGVCPHEMVKEAVA